MKLYSLESGGHVIALSHMTDKVRGIIPLIESEGQAIALSVWRIRKEVSYL